jgi:dihydrolipoamide dehydrogenase
VPWVIYTSPEIAWVGKTEQQLKAEGVAYKAGKIPFAANGRALGMGDTTASSRCCLRHDRPHSRRAHHRRQRIRADLRGRGGDGVRCCSEDLARICHAHPTLSEVVHEAALACDKRPLHF